MDAGGVCLLCIFRLRNHSLDIKMLDVKKSCKPRPYRLGLPGAGKNVPTLNWGAAGSRQHLGIAAVNRFRILTRVRELGHPVEYGIGADEFRWDAGQQAE